MRSISVPPAAKAAVFTLLVISGLSETTAHGYPAFEELEKNQSSFLQIERVIDVAKVFGQKLGTHVDLSLDQKGGLIIADADNRRILTYSIKEGRGDILQLPENRFVAPRSAAIDSSGRLYVANPESHEVLVKDEKWHPLGGWTGFESPFDRPVDVEVTAEGTLIVLDAAKRAVFFFDPRGDRLRSVEIPTSLASAESRYGLTTLTTALSGVIYLIDADSQQILKGDKRGFKSFVKMDGRQPRFLAGLAVGDDRQVFVSDYLDNSLLEYDDRGNFVQEHVVYKYLLQQPTRMAFGGNHLAAINEGKDQILIFRLKHALSGVEHALLGEEHLIMGYPQEAVHELRLAAKLGYNRPEVYFLLGEAYYAQGDYKAALPQFMRVLEADPKNIEALFYVAKAYHRLEAYEKSVEFYARVLAIDGGHVGATINLGESYLATGKVTEAEAYFRKALAVSPDSATAWFGLGRALLERGRLQEAENALEHALAKGQIDREARHFLGVTYLAQKDFSKAKVLLERASETGPYFIDALYRLGLAYEYSGKRDEALRHFQRVLELKPDHTEAARHMSLLKRD